MEFFFNGGWVRDLPDCRDFTVQHPEIAPLLQKLNVPATGQLPAATNNTQWYSPVEYQGNIGSCTAHALAGIVEYMENRAYGKNTPISRLFMYRAARQLQNFTGDHGSSLRGMMGALALFGAPPEKYWPYTDQDGWDNEPSAFVYALAQSFKAIKYYRLDPSGTTPADTLLAIKTQLAAGIPAMFGFTVYNSIGQASSTGMIPYPAQNDTVAGGHGVGAFDYNDSIQIINTLNGQVTTGAFKIKNSWGIGWGPLGGYLWLPYQYVLSGLAVDWWSLLSQNYVDTQQFGF